MKGILFKPDMIKAIVEGRKIVTRRIIKPQPNERIVGDMLQANIFYRDGDPNQIYHPKYLCGETVYIKEAWELHYDKLTTSFYIDFSNPRLSKRVDVPKEWLESDKPLFRKRSPMFLPEKFARYFIKIKDVRPERLKEINNPHDEVLKEGYPFGYNICELHETPVKTYERLWDSINKKTPWASNPWVWRIEFERVEVSR